MNLLFAIPVLWLVFVIGIQMPAYSKYTWIGTVNKGSPAEAAGMEPGWRILSIAGVPTGKWEDVQLKIWTSEDEPLDIELEDFSGDIIHVTATPKVEEGSARAALGIEPLIAEAVMAVFPGMPAERGGLKVGDMILAFNGAPPTNESLGKLIDSVNRSAGREMTLTVLREGHVLGVTLTPEEVSIVKGVIFDKNVVAYVDAGDMDEGEPSSSALQRGDMVVAVNGNPVGDKDFEDRLTGSIYNYDGKDIQLTIERPQGFFQEPLTLMKTATLTRTGRIGVSFSPFVLEKFGPAQAFVRSIDAFGYSLALTMKTLYFLVSGKVSTKEMAGPIGIAVMTEKSLELGIGYYLQLVAFITINLAIVNLLPIPLLDGGMIFLLIVESIRRKPLEEKYLVILQKVGMAFIFLLILVATYNDILRSIRVFFGGDFIE